jgi:transcriptional regulator with PAS, ATPase and Fis domain
MNADDIVHDLVGVSPAIRQIIQFIGTVAGKDATVLIRGESGTGKELVARAIHENSARAGGPFAALNCAAVPEELLESELFGHEKGAFTHAAAQKKGRFEAADGGTLFLDEIGDMKLSMQVKLLRVLQERQFERLGGLRPIHIDVRLITATHRDLQSMAAARTFREDLYYRIRVVAIDLPPLRERPEDILPLAQHFLEKYSKKHDREVRGISEEAETLLRRYHWPGNIRELEHAIEAGVVLGSGELIVARDLPREIVITPPRSLMKAFRGLQKMKEQVERFAVENALTVAEGGLREAARILEIHHRSLYRLIHKYNLNDLVKGGTI